MENSRLGNTDLYISRIGFGCAPIGGYDYGKVDDSESKRAILHAIDKGIKFFDTADVYGFGHAEELLGEALSLRKQNVIVATKFGVNWNENGHTWRDISPLRVMEAVDHSLKRLRRDFIDLYQVHWPEHNARMEDTYDALMNCQQHGKIKHIGFCNYDLASLKELQNKFRIDSLQNSYNLLNRTIETNLLEFCRIKGVSFIAHSSLARGFLSGKYSEEYQFDGPDTRSKSQYFSNQYRAEKSALLNALKRISLKYGKTLSQVAIRWVLDNDLVDCSLVGFKYVEQVDEILGSLDWKLTSEDYQHLALLTEPFLKTGLR